MQHVKCGLIEVDWIIEPARTALINVDLQNCFVDSIAEPERLLERINAVAAACRDVGISVIHTRHVVRADGSNMGLLRQIPRIRDGQLSEGAPTAELTSMLFVDRRDQRLDKPRFGAFHATDLELTLRAGGIDSIIITGISTSICCDTTAREAHARDFRVFFLSDATATPAGPDDQQRTLDVLDGRFAQVLSVDDLLLKLRVATSH